MEPARGATAALIVALMLAALSQCPSGAPHWPERAVACGTEWVEVESEEGLTVAVACATSGRPAATPVGPARLLLGLPIELNRASAATLEALPGIGPGRADAIVRERCRAPFEALVDAARVHGIGPKTVARLRGHAIAGPPTPDCASAPTLPP